MLWSIHSHPINWNIGKYVFLAKNEVNNQHDDTSVVWDQESRDVFQSIVGFVQIFRESTPISVRACSSIFLLLYVTLPIFLRAARHTISVQKGWLQLIFQLGFTLLKNPLKKPTCWIPNQKKRHSGRLGNIDKALFTRAFNTVFEIFILLLFGFFCVQLLIAARFGYILSIHCVSDAPEAGDMHSIKRGVQIMRTCSSFWERDDQFLYSTLAWKCFSFKTELSIR